MIRAAPAAWGLVWVLMGCAVQVAEAHPALFTSAHIYIQPDGRYQLFTSFDLLAFALRKTSLEIGDPPMNALLDGPPEVLNQTLEQSRIFFGTKVTLQTDHGPGAVSELHFPTPDDVEQWKASGRKPRLPVVARVEVDGTLPANASQVQLQFPVCLGTVVLTVDRPDDQVYDEPIAAGFASSHIPVRLKSTHSLEPAAQEAASEGWPVWRRFFSVGVRCILPAGADPICFIVGLFLGSTRWSLLLGQVVAFTLGQSFTLAMTFSGCGQSPFYFIEPALALTIVWVGIDNLQGPRASSRRLLVVFACGLLYGLEFATVFQAAGGLKLSALIARVGFSGGLEVGQLLVILAALLLVEWYRTSRHYRSRVVVPVSLLLSLLGACWFIQRVFGSA